MDLNILKRTTEKKREPKRLRREGNIPAILYSRGVKGEPLSISSADFKGILRKIIPGRLSTTRFTLIDEKGKKRRAIIKDIQYNITNYDVIHLDFEELLPDQKVNIKIPVECVGQADCSGIKLGGVLRLVNRYLKIECLPDQIPDVFEVDIRSLSVGQYKKFSDLAIPENIRPKADLNEVVVVIAKR